MLGLAPFAWRLKATTVHREGNIGCIRIDYVVSRGKLLVSDMDIIATFHGLRRLHDKEAEALCSNLEDT